MVERRDGPSWLRDDDNDDMSYDSSGRQSPCQTRRTENSNNNVRYGLTSNHVAYPRNYTSV